MTAARRVSLEPAFLLHHSPWRDSSRILELITRAYGRVSVIARASRQSSSAVGSALQPFAAALVSWTTRGELGYLSSAEKMPAAAAAAPQPGEMALGATSSGPALSMQRLAGDRLMSGFYASELLLKLLQRNDPHPTLFDAYAALIARLQDATADPARALRIFEKRLLDELGWGLNLEHEAGSGAPLEPGRSYRYGIEGGAEPVDGVAEGTLIFCGASLLSLAREDLGDARSLADARLLLRAALDRVLEGRTLRTREVLLEMRAHSGRSEGG
ncbi:MAG: DNA repair protein RecO [Steroidobacteraceae bacterium]